MKTYTHKYHVFYPLNIYVGFIKKKCQGIRKLLHFLSFAVGFQDLMKEVDEEIKRKSIN